MNPTDPILLGVGTEPVFLLPKFGNRHGLIAGATGTGKTVTLQSLAEGFSKRGVPVFMADVKGDLSGLSQAGGDKPVFDQRAQELGLEDYNHQGYPVTFWDVFGEQGHPIRATISEMGPLLLSRLMDLNETQEGVLNIAFKLADEQGLLLIDLKDLRALLTEVSEKSGELTDTYGNVSPASIGAIQRSLLVLEQQGAEQFFGEPALDLNDLMTQTGSKGTINILAADKLLQNPRLYATFLLWLLSELFEILPEVGDRETPKLVFFFDEAHLLFNDAPKALLEKIEQVVRLIRSKGVGVYFVTQNPLDIPDTVLGQLGNRVQHALRAFTPRDQKAVDAAADTFRQNPKFKTDRVITELAVGEALVSTLDEKGTPNIVQRAKIVPPESRVGPISASERQGILNHSGQGGRYDQAIDRETAYEVLKARNEQREQEEAAQAQAEAEAKEQARQAKQSSGGRGDSMLEAMGKSLLRSVGTQVGRQLVRGILGGLLRR